MDLVGRDDVWHVQIFVESANCCQGAKANISRSIKSFLERSRWAMRVVCTTAWAMGMQRSN